MRAESLTASSRWSLCSEDSLLSIASKASVLSVGSIGSCLSVGSIGSFGSLLSVGAFFSGGSALSALSRWSVMSWRSSRSVQKATTRRRHDGRPVPTGLLVAAAALAGIGARRERNRWRRRHSPAMQEERISSHGRDKPQRREQGVISSLGTRPHQVRS